LAKRKKKLRYVPAPLKGSFMIISIIGFLISAMYLIPLSLTWGLMLTIFFTITFVASLVSMTHAPTLEK